MTRSRFFGGSRKVFLLAMLGLASLAVTGQAAQAQVRAGVTAPGVRVRVGPPPVRVETRPARPSPAHVWIDGHWDWRRDRHEWVGGYWAVPPQTGYVWEAGRWVNEGGAWVYYQGQWRAAPAPTPRVVYAPPPAPAPRHMERRDHRHDRGPGGWRHD
jgi:hypothetical protein